MRGKSFHKSSKRFFTAEEDDTLRKLVKDGVKVNWKKMEKYFKNRTARQLKERYINYLDPNINRSEFTEEEEKVILRLVENHGTVWSVISSVLTGRTENQLKMYYNTKLLKRIKKDEVNSKEKESEERSNQES